jgi:hypothetical protein
MEQVLQVEKKRVIDITESNEPDNGSQKRRKIDIGFCQDVRTDINLFLATLSEKYHYNFSLGNIIYDSDLNTLSTRIKADAPGATKVKSVDPDEKRNIWNRSCRKFGLDSSMFGKIFM